MEILAVVAFILAIVAGALALLLPDRLNFAVLTLAVGVALFAAGSVFG